MHYIFIISLILVIVFVLWIFLGGGDHNFVGLQFLQNKNDINTNEENSQQELQSEDIQISLDENEKQENTIDITPDIPVFVPSEQDKTKSYGERISCSTLEEIYKKPFKSVRPDFLRNPETGRNMELDCYNEELKIAVEYNGIQHYCWPNYTKCTKEEFIRQVQRDQLKVKLCDENGVYLIRVPYKVPKSMIATYIRYHTPENMKRKQNVTLKPWQASSVTYRI